MAYYKFEPIKELENLAGKMRKFVDDFPDSFSFEVGNSFQPRIDVLHDEGFVTVLIELPGVAKSDVHLTLQENVLTVKGEKRKSLSDETLVYSRMERQYGAFQRAIPLPFDLVPSSVEAGMEQGVLTVRMAKVRPQEARKVDIEIK